VTAAESTFSFSAAGWPIEGDRLLHRGQRQQLQQVVLDDVAGGADAVVVAGAPADADVLGHGDLHVVDVVGVPDRLEQLVGEAQRQEVLHRLLAEVVVDAEDRVRREDRLDDRVELTGAGEIVPERLLDDHPTPRSTVRVGQPRAIQLLADRTEEPRRDRQVERVVAAGAAVRVQVVHGVASGRRPRRRRSARHEADALGEGLPDVLTEGGAGVLAHRVVDDLAEVLIGPVPASEADQAKPGGSRPRLARS
jgi:hypothetical protein